MNTLDNSAHLYDLDQRDNLSADIPFYFSYAVGNILELGCGTGRMAIPLANAGYDVTGLDLSESMLNVFKAKITDKSDRITIAHGNMADFSFDKKFDLIIAPFRAFQALTDDTDIQNCLNCVREHLSDSGKFIVNVFRPYKILDESWCYPETVQWERTDEATGNLIVKKHWGDRIDTAKQIIYPNYAFEVTSPDGEMQRIVDHLALKYYYCDQLKSLLTNCGFNIAEEFGWYDKSPIESGRELIFICGKNPM